MLCPVSGGALKRTVCHRWVHVFCAMWTPGCWILSMRAMQPIEVRPTFAVALYAKAITGYDQLSAAISHPLASECFKSSRGGTADFSRLELASSSPVQMSSELPTVPCSVCFQSVGRTVRCAGSANSSQQCGAHMHALCAWFTGHYMTVSEMCTESKGHGLFYCGGGAGLRFSVYCTNHVPVESISRSMDQQKSIRCSLRVCPPILNAATSIDLARDNATLRDCRISDAASPKFYRKMTNVMHLPQPRTVTPKAGVEFAQSGPKSSISSKRNPKRALTERSRSSRHLLSVMKGILHRERLKRSLLSTLGRVFHLELAALEPCDDIEEACSANLTVRLRCTFGAAGDIFSATIISPLD
jgi:hypothetical protein